MSQTGGTAGGTSGFTLGGDSGGTAGSTREIIDSVTFSVDVQDQQVVEYTIRGLA